MIRFTDLDIGKRFTFSDDTLYTKISANFFALDRYTNYANYMFSICTQQGYPEMLILPEKVDYEPK